jgi:hypothetical protein
MQMVPRGWLSSMAESLDLPRSITNAAMRRNPVTHELCEIVTIGAILLL